MNSHQLEFPLIDKCPVVIKIFYYIIPLPVIPVQDGYLLCIIDFSVEYCTYRDDFIVESLYPETGNYPPPTFKGSYGLSRPDLVMPYETIGEAYNLLSGTIVYSKLEDDNPGKETPHPDDILYPGVAKPVD